MQRKEKQERPPKARRNDPRVVIAGSVQAVADDGGRGVATFWPELAMAESLLGRIIQENDELVLTESLAAVQPILHG